ncbi:MAG TPA: peptide-methionine (S)-S-oxide reductase MsrA [Methanospirillum sp.]|uniref:peptide-methionine (S)-S-oxide reductase MsrA n=1 Tax=Methanospirillum sp. TaxID=45200 RepID=UPI002BC08BD8|nr:peptide-methionine (S)-S-oxide reductase MsrA [Methanospirillum sp.]HOJ97502.1 peptide-methionine (S)-S-oxide reductase MsrA [Methanospirillum sp.]HOL41374.1 peptide-methionine (S)-S-oxide reductase MsrA [Methanospirillum sp.]HPP76802.1 peptide-methionine (S)-S-oxide reductase MsrA [Methanospirillum sp.]
MAIAFFAGGCFWGIEAGFQRLPGVLSTRVGYMGGHTNDPTYQDVCSDTTGHAETVAIEYDEAVLSYRRLLEVFFSLHNPTEINRQGPDIGSQYRSVIFYTTQEQKDEAERFIRELNDSGRYAATIATEIVPASPFWPAEEYHQSYYLKMGQRYGPGLL